MPESKEESSSNETIAKTTQISKVTSLVEKIETTNLEETEYHVIRDEMNDAAAMIRDVIDNTVEIANKKQNLILLKLLIRLRIRKCQLLGKHEEWKQMIEETEEIMTHLVELNDEVDFDYRSNVEAKISGYKGVSLMKLYRIDEAIITLSRSYELRMNKANSVALIDEPREQDKKTFNQREKRETIQVERALLACCQMKGVDAPIPPLTKFSRTVHLFNTGGTAVTSDDLVMSKDDIIYNQMADEKTTLYIEEKVDGANFGLSLSGDGKIFAQNRSHYISSGDHAQFSPLTTWIEEHREALTNILSQEQGNRTASQGLILYGEWVVARHSIPYHKLPGHFIAFDIYDRKVQRFWSRSRFHSIMKGSGIPVVPIIMQGTLASFDNCSSKGNSSTSFKKDLVDLLETRSSFRTDGGPVEGIVLRIDDDDKDEQGRTWLKSRLKIVRPDFIRGCREGHWSRREIEKQTIDYEFSQSYLNECYKCADESKIMQ